MVTHGAAVMGRLSAICVSIEALGCVPAGAGGRCAVEGGRRGRGRGAASVCLAGCGASRGGRGVGARAPGGAGRGRGAGCALRRLGCAGGVGRGARGASGDGLAGARGAALGPSRAPLPGEHRAGGGVDRDRSCLDLARRVADGGRHLVVGAGSDALGRRVAQEVVGRRGAGVAGSGVGDAPRARASPGRSVTGPGVGGALGAGSDGTARAPGSHAGAPRRARGRWPTGRSWTSSSRSRREKVSSSGAAAASRRFV